MKEYSVTNEERIFSTSRMECVNRTLTSEDGDAFTHTIIKSRPSVVTIIRNDDGQIALIRQLRSTTNKQYWELPGGLKDTKERFMCEVAVRETREETGILIKNVQLLVQGPSLLDCGKSNEDYGVALATAYGKGERRLDKNEHIAKDILWMSEEEVFMRLQWQMESGAYFYDGLHMSGHSVYALLSYWFLCK